MHLLQANINLVEIKEFLGHADDSITEPYGIADNKAKQPTKNYGVLCSLSF